MFDKILNLARRPSPSQGKPLWARLLDKTAAPFWFARLRRRGRHWYRNGVAAMMQLTSSCMYRVEVRGLENFSYSPSTIIACGHKRDMDIPIIVPRFYFWKRPGRLKTMRMMHAAARDDIFERGFLTVYFPHLNWLRPLLTRLDVKMFFQALQGCPVKLPDEQTVNQLLQETCRIEGNLKVEEALSLEWQAQLEAKPNATLKQILNAAPIWVLTQYATPRIFSESLANRIRLRHHATMVAQLEHITRILEKGGTLIVLPEGRVTPDGRFCKMRAAVTRLVLQTRVETKLLPVNLTYDFMDTIRPNVTMLIGPEIENLKHLSKTELADLIRQKVAGLVCVSLSGLVSRWLVEAANKGIGQIKLSEFREEIWAEIQRLCKLGLAVDRQLATRQEFEERFNRFVMYARHMGGIFVEEIGFEADLFKLNLPLLSRSECNKPTDNPIRYCYNELTELLEMLGVISPAEATDEVSNFKKLKQAGRRLTAG